jgi:hypothetical protein
MYPYVKIVDKYFEKDLKFYLPGTKKYWSNKEREYSHWNRYLTESLQKHIYQ